MTLSGALEKSANITTVTNGTGVTVSQTVNSWSNDPNLTVGLQTLFSIAGAFQFQSGSADCAALILLAPGAYTIQATTTGAGELLTEVYVLPYGT
jgi:hypothetical protein